MESFEFLTKEMWDEMPSPAKRLLSIELTTGWYSGLRNIRSRLDGLKSEKYLMYYSWLLSGIFAEMIQEPSLSWFYTVEGLNEFIKQNSKNGIYEKGIPDYPHIALFDYYKEHKKSDE